MNHSEIVYRSTHLVPTEVREGSVQSNHSELTSKTSTHLAFSAQKWFEKVRGGSLWLNHSEIVYMYPTHFVPTVKMRFGTVEPLQTLVKDFYTPYFLCTEVVREGSRRFAVVEPLGNSVQVPEDDLLCVTDQLRLYCTHDAKITRCVGFTFPKQKVHQCVVMVTVTWERMGFKYTLTPIEDSECHSHRIAHCLICSTLPWPEPGLAVPDATLSGRPPFVL